ncbi:MAG TPA: GvpL/GvpF family gas vesicle protein, partial [Vicinamibacterales bacterium]|nr:GvpL/GvpF family gas vesicle protein [Vicinamibacterales bacterium]
MTGGSATYVYGVIAGARRRAKKSTGLPGTGPVRLVELDGNLAAAVANAPLKLYGEDPLARKLSDLEWVSRAAIAHESVLESFAEATAIVPMKLFTLFTSEERAIAHLRAERSRIAATVRRVANQQEWGVRVALAAPRTAGDRARNTDRRGETGAQFLARKKTDRAMVTELAARAAETV